MAKAIAVYIHSEPDQMIAALLGVQPDPEVYIAAVREDGAIFQRELHIGVMQRVQWTNWRRNGDIVLGAGVPVKDMLPYDLLGMDMIMPDGKGPATEAFFKNGKCKLKLPD